MSEATKKNINLRDKAFYWVVVNEGDNFEIAQYQEKYNQFNFENNGVVMPEDCFAIDPNEASIIIWEFDIKLLKKDLLNHRLLSDIKIRLRHAADQIGISPATLSRIENLKTPDIETLVKICTWLGKSPEHYFIKKLRKDH